MSPKVGDIWLDDNMDHNLVLHIDASDQTVSILTLDTKKVWDHNPFEDFGEDRYFHTRVA
mgnify:CR=1 FL=1